MAPRWAIGLKEQPAVTVKILVNGEFFESNTTVWGDAVNPATQRSVGASPFVTDQEIATAILAAREALEDWKRTSIATQGRCAARRTSANQARSAIAAALAGIQLSAMRRIRNIETPR